MKMRIRYPIVCEGKYDKIKLDSVVDAMIIPTDGFGIFKNEEKVALIRKLCENEKIIVLTDSDGAGALIRGHLNGIVPKERIINLYTPAISGKERRKVTPSKEGVLGVEGQDAQLLRDILAPFASDQNEQKSTAPITKTHFYEDGLSGGENSTLLRTKLAIEYGLPPSMSANALLEALNLISNYDQYKQIISTIGVKNEKEQ